MKKNLVLILLSLFYGQIVYSQYDYDALRFSQSFIQSDARSVGVGGAFGALGANSISTLINPAGIALFRKGEIFVSTGFTNSNNRSEYLGTSVKTGKNSFNISAFGLVFTSEKEKDKNTDKEWKAVNFSLGLFKTNSYNGRYNYFGENRKSSMLEYFAESAQGRNVDNLPYLTKMAYDVWLINNPFHPKIYITALSDDTAKIINVNQSQISRVKGSSYEMNFGLAGNYSDLFYLGIKMGIPFLNYSYSKTFFEENNRIGKSNYISMQYENLLDASGIGFNTSLGIIVRPFEYVRFGGSIHSPTFFSINEDYKDKIISNLDTSGTYSSSRNGTFNYYLTTPFKAVGSIAFIFKTYGFLSFDYEYIDYSTAFLSSNNYSFVYENENIENQFNTVGNIRVGGEIKLGDFAVRGGYSYYPSPIKEDYRPKNSDKSVKIFSIGLGYRDKYQYFDLAWQSAVTSEYEIPYLLSTKEVKGVDYHIKNSTILLTVGFKI